MDRIIAQTKEAKATGVRESALSDLLLSRMKPQQMSNLAAHGSGHSIIAPFFMKPQRHRINANYFEVVSGSATSGAGSGGIPASSWDLIVRNHQGSFASPLTNIEQYFLVGTYVVVLHKAVDGTGRTIQFKVLASTNADSGGVSRATLRLEPNINATTWGTYTSGQKLPYQPTAGLVIPLANSVSDYESWCSQDPSTNELKLLTYWWQTIRETHCYNDGYLKALTAPLTSEYFKRFKTIPLAQQRKQQAMAADRRLKNTLFWGQRIDDLQTANGYTNLPQVVDPAVSGCVLEYKSNTIGWRQQLADCSRVTDFQGGQLDLDTVFELLYNLKRHRQQDSGEITSIDVMTDRTTANLIQTLMIDYYKKKYQMDTTRYYKPNEAITHNNQVLWNYASYQVAEAGVDLNVIHDTFFDDFLAATPSGVKSMGRKLMFLDFSDIYMAVGRTTSVKRETGPTNAYDDLYKCVITPNVKHYTLTSKTIAAVIEDPNRHAIFENFDGGCPSLTGATPCHAS